MLVNIIWVIIAIVMLSKKKIQNTDEDNTSLK